MSDSSNLIRSNIQQPIVLIKPQRPKKKRKFRIGLFQKKKHNEKVQKSSTPPPLPLPTPTLPLLSDTSSSLTLSTLTTTPPINTFTLVTSHTSTPTTPTHSTTTIPYNDMPHSALSLGPKKQKMNFDQQKEIRIAIKVIFEIIYYDTFTMEQLTKVINKVMHMLNYHHYSTVKHVILSTKDALDAGLEYDAERKNEKLHVRTQEKNKEEFV